MISSLILPTPFEELGLDIMLTLYLFVQDKYPQLAQSSFTVHKFISLKWKPNDIVTNSVYEEKVIERMKLLIQNQPDEYLQILMESSEDLESSKRDFVDKVLNAVVKESLGKGVFDTKETTIITITLSLVTTCDSACFFLLKCMKATDLPTLLRRLIKMAFTKVTYQNQICKVLIAKVLVVDHWASESLLFYMDLIREFNINKKFINIPYEYYLSKNATPADITDMVSTDCEAYQKTNEHYILTDTDVKEHVKDLVSVAEYWGRKVTIQVAKRGLRQLIQYTFSSPSNETNITLWNSLSSALIEHRSLVWLVIRKCIALMKQQREWEENLKDKSVYDVSSTREKLLYDRLCPMLILQSIHSNAYSSVKLPEEVLENNKDFLIKCKGSINCFKVSTVKSKRDGFCEELLNVLLLRSEQPLEFVEIEKFSRELVGKMFTKPEKHTQ
ncbi:hypothetical protein BDF14DRAFT_1436212 [Spinellus fusiger]|nr:hypothetical protein BDF14DRAFT_1436212 [Spinellus fusiger]